jgi:hypothetical protein
MLAARIMETRGSQNHAENAASRYNKENLCRSRCRGRVGAFALWLSETPGRARSKLHLPLWPYSAAVV